MQSIELFTKLINNSQAFWNEMFRLKEEELKLFVKQIRSKETCFQYLMFEFPYSFLEFESLLIEKCSAIETGILLNYLTDLYFTRYNWPIDFNFKRSIIQIQLEYFLSNHLPDDKMNLIFGFILNLTTKNYYCCIFII